MRIVARPFEDHIALVVGDAFEKATEYRAVRPEFARRRAAACPLQQRTTLMTELPFEMRMSALGLRLPDAEMPKLEEPCNVFSLNKD